MPENVFMWILGNLVVVLVRVYQICISPFMGPCCRFYPTCSEYAIIAVRRYGPLRGAFLGLMRILRCHPFHTGGYDPVK
jgi:putative membrane protein insertion efficiency factor